MRHVLKKLPPTPPHLPTTTEAVETYREAERLAHEQTKRDLHQMWATEGPDSASEDGSSGSDTGPTDPNGSSSSSSLVSFWQEQGLSAGEAQRLSRELLRSRSPYADVSRLSAQLQRIERLLPAGPGSCPQLVARWGGGQEGLGARWGGGRQEGLGARWGWGGRRGLRPGGGGRAGGAQGLQHGCCLPSVRWMPALSLLSTGCASCPMASPPRLPVSDIGLAPTHRAGG